MSEPKRGDLVLVRWLDIVESLDGSDDDADLVEICTAGFFASLKRKRGTGSSAVEYVVLSYHWSDDPDAARDPGWIAIPRANVVKMETLKKCSS
ncbi:MAG: hypothetical protein D6760_03185 [Deltaproteobacteria bacterium]|nr:MAG: hypothetical protein D6760_03185 [Deltaproteobacteria bacterium]